MSEKNCLFKNKKYWLSAHTIDLIDLCSFSRNDVKITIFLENLLNWSVSDCKKLQ